LSQAKGLIKQTHRKETPPMTNRLKGKTAFVTAAGQGIGRATAEAFVREGARVIATDISEALVSDLAKTVGCETRHLDVTDANAVAAAAKEAGAMNILFNGAGYVHAGTILDCDERAFDFSFDLNVRAMYRMIRAFLPAMLASYEQGGGGGSIINVASVAGSIKGAPNRFVYGATKAAVIGLTKSVAADFIKHKLRCNAICPGTIQTPSLDDRIAAQGGTPAARQAFVDRQPLGRLGTPEEMAALVLYLASDESAFTTGTAVIADGGFTL
jgi:2-keto-3-deoxy-L-fuconate dehydrogenase